MMALIEFNPFVVYSESIGICLALMLVLFFLNFKNWMYKRINFLSITYVIVILEIVSDWIWFFIDGHVEYSTLNKYMELTYLLIYPFLGWFWLCYCLNSLGFKKQTAFFIKMVGLICILGVTVLTVVSLQTKQTFYIDENGTYVRGPLYILIPVMTGINLLAASVCSAIGAANAKLLSERKNCIVQACFIIPVIITGVINFILPPGCPITYFGIAISFMFVYMNTLGDQITQDKLTKTLNRFTFDKKLEDTIKNYNKVEKQDSCIYLILVDVDNFKNYNVENGYLAGDKLLAFIADVVNKASYSIDGLVGRVGSDEFAILVESKDSLAPKALMDAIPRVLRDALVSEKIEANISLTLSSTLYKKGTTRKAYTEEAGNDLYKVKKHNPILKDVNIRKYEKRISK